MYHQNAHGNCHPHFSIGFFAGTRGAIRSRVRPVYNALVMIRICNQTGLISGARRGTIRIVFLYRIALVRFPARG